MKTCLYCHKPLTRYGQRKFCCRSCAASFNNKSSPRKTKTKKCKLCGKLIYSSHTYCSSCHSAGIPTIYGKPIPECTIAEVSKYKDASRYVVIRTHARRTYVTKDQKCCYCGYDKHVEACHIKPIESFPKDTTIKEVNSPQNIVLLCPNCHWEFDNNLLTI